jgi:hypothetical protein
LKLLAETLDLLAGDPELGQKVGAAAHLRARTLTWREHGRRVEEPLLAVAEKRRHARSN